MKSEVQPEVQQCHSGTFLCACQEAWIVLCARTGARTSADKPNFVAIGAVTLLCVLNHVFQAFYNRLDYKTNRSE